MASEENEMAGNAIILREGPGTHVSLTSNAIFTRISEGVITYADEIAREDLEKAEPAYLAGCEQLLKGENFAAIGNFTIAAELGHCAAQLQLANIFLEGNKATIDYAAAIYWFGRAAEQGEAKAHLKLGWMSEAGLGNPRNSRTAVYWYRIAAEAGNAEAQFNIGVKYDNGEGVEHNPEEAVRWFLMSAEQGFSDARYFLGQALENGDGIERKCKRPWTGTSWQQRAGILPPVVDFGNFASPVSFCPNRRRRHFLPRKSVRHWEIQSASSKWH
jgi:TPR repeat protein